MMNLQRRGKNYLYQEVIKEEEEQREKDVKQKIKGVKRKEVKK